MQDRNSLMQDWWSYTLSDFLLFSPRTYYRMLERHNEAVWPAQLLTLALGIGILVLLRRPSAKQGRIIAGILALLWVWIAWAFLLSRYATINWAMKYVAPLFVFEALLLVWWGVIGGKLIFTVEARARAKTGSALFMLGLLLYPALPMIFGTPWKQAEVFGIAPDPTVIATAGLLLLVNSRFRWGLLPVPLIWCAITAATLWAMSAQS
jgi:hypothetical protein